MTERLHRLRWVLRLCALLLPLLLLECGAQGARIAGFVHVSPLPETRRSQFWSDINKDFGVWHRSERTFHHKSACFEATYRSNSDGARDPERTRRFEGNRIAVLGDSFVEGWGVDDAQRMTTLLEQQTGLQHLNFGTSGSFGPVQQWTQYESFVADFDHSEVYLFFLPRNDFNDDDPTVRAERYRPLLRPIGGGFERYYAVPFAEQQRSRTEVWFNRLHNRSATVALGTKIYHHLQWRLKAPEQAASSTAPRAHYDDFSELAGRRLRFAYTQLAQLTQPRPLTIFIVPSLRDMQLGGGQGRAPQLLAELPERFGHLRVVDLLPGMLNAAAQRGMTPKDLFLPCDPHWSPLGHEVAAEVVAAATGRGPVRQPEALGDPSS